MGWLLPKGRLIAAYACRERIYAFPTKDFRKLLISDFQLLAYGF